MSVFIFYFYLIPNLACGIYECFKYVGAVCDNQSVFYLCTYFFSGIRKLIKFVNYSFLGNSPASEF